MEFKILDTTIGVGKSFPVMRSPSEIENTANVLSAYSNNVLAKYE